MSPYMSFTNTIHPVHPQESMILALKTVVDLSEADIVSLIQVFVSAHGENSEGAMQVDESTSVAVPSLPSVLSLCLSYPTSAAALRLAIRQQLRDSKDLTCILQILSGWLDSWCEDDVQLLPERTKKDLHGALVPVLEDKRKDTVPPVNNVSLDILASERPAISPIYTGPCIPTDVTRLVIPCLPFLSTITRPPPACTLATIA